MVEDIKTHGLLQYSEGSMKTTGVLVNCHVPKYFRKFMLGLETHDNEAVYLKVRLQEDEPGWPKMIAILYANGDTLSFDEIIFPEENMYTQEIHIYLKRVVGNLVEKMIINFARYERTGNQNNQGKSEESSDRPIDPTEAQEGKPESGKNSGGSEEDSNTEKLAKPLPGSTPGFGSFGSGHGEANDEGGVGR
jgi:hypothetical protein